MAAPEGNAFAAGNPGGGRPSQYKEEYARIAYSLCLLGATDQDLAENFGVSEQTINNWKDAHEDFSLALKRGKVIADAEIAHSLYSRAKGAEWVEQAAFKVRNQPSPGIFIEEVQIVELRKAAPPDTQAASLWLRNRRPRNWKDTQHIEQTVTEKEAPTQFASPEEAAAAYAEHINT